MKLTLAFLTTLMASEAPQHPNWSPRRLAATAITNANIETAVNLWTSNRASCISTYGHISDWDTSQVTDMKSLFWHKETFNDDISRWDTSRVTTMETMFYANYVFNGDLSKWNTSAVVSMHKMFYKNWVFNGDISKWKTSKVTDMRVMFCYCNAFNRDIGNWDTSNVETMSGVFYDAYAFDQDLTSWDLSLCSAANTFDSMFSGKHTMAMTTINKPCKVQGGSPCQCPASKSLDVATQICHKTVTLSPTASPTKRPTAYPTPTPTAYPTPYPTPTPTAYPTPEPTTYPTRAPTASPTALPTASPTAMPTTVPSAAPTKAPTKAPTANGETYTPTTYPTPAPTPWWKKPRVLQPCNDQLSGCDTSDKPCYPNGYSVMHDCAHTSVLNNTELNQTVYYRRA